MSTSEGRAQTLPGLYIHFPFCRSKCAYCDFYSETALDLIPEFLAAAAAEMELYRSAFPIVDSIYFGGGTPSILEMDGISFLLSQIRRNFEVVPGSEITIEVNPGDLDLRYGDLFSLGFNRINIGLQSLDDATLRFLGRRHRVTAGLQSIDAAAKAGFTNIGVDLIYGVPGESLKAFLSRLKILDGRPITHLSCYQLTEKEGTLLASRRQAGICALPSDDDLASFFLEISQSMEDRGFIHYEVSNFSVNEAFESRHNSKYWRHVPYLGIGPAAHSFARCHRWANPPSLAHYLARLRKNKKPAGVVEPLGMEELRLEALFLGLRTRRGVDLSTLPGNQGAVCPPEIGMTLDKLSREGLLIREGNIIRPTRRGMALADSMSILLTTS